MTSKTSRTTVKMTVVAVSRVLESRNTASVYSLSATYTMTSNSLAATGCRNSSEASMVRTAQVVMLLIVNCRTC